MPNQMKIITVSGGKNKPCKPHFPYQIGIFNRLFRDKNVRELLNPSKGSNNIYKESIN